ncbi:MAG: hypothetical protein WA771_05310 [Chthoniobacterales bacterium]
MTVRLLLALVLCAASSFPGFAQDTSAAEPSETAGSSEVATGSNGGSTASTVADDPSTYPTLSAEELESAAQVENVSVPTPGEFFAAINKIERPNWSQLDRPGALSATTSRVRLSLNVGARVADGFIAVEAQDGQQVRNTGRDIIDLAKGLGVSESIIARGSSIGDFAENNEWTALKEELEATENEVKLQMAAQRDEPLVILVTIGAWLRGMQAASEVIGTNYSESAAELLRQPAIVEFLVARLGALPNRMQEDNVIEEIEAGILEIRKTTDLPAEQTLTEADVEAINSATTRLVEFINTADSDNPES